MELVEGVEACALGEGEEALEAAMEGLLKCEVPGPAVKVVVAVFAYPLVIAD